MADNQQFPLLNRQTVGASQNGEIVDLVLYNTLNIGATVHSAGSAGNIKLEHSDSTDPDTFQNLTTISSAPPARALSPSATSCGSSGGSPTPV